MKRVLVPLLSPHVCGMNNKTKTYKVAKSSVNYDGRAQQLLPLFTTRLKYLYNHKNMNDAVGVSPPRQRINFTLATLQRCYNFLLLNTPDAVHFTN